MSVGKCFEGNKNQSLTIPLEILCLLLCITYNGDVQFITMYCMEMKVIF